jgi:RNA polymerase sigma-70 factor (ECF subfamily)
MNMDTQTSSEDLAALLEHSTWVRRLAGSLVRDDALADDLTQEAWLAAMRHPPDKGRPLRPWLAQVLRNLVRMRFRGDRRRQGREQSTSAAQSSDSLASPEQLLSRVEMQRALSSLVVGLEEPFRSTILLRYYEGLDASDIAERQGVPPGTVRWRVKTGLDRLRAALDRKHGGDRRAWLPAVAPLAFDIGGQGAVPGPPMHASVKSALTLKAALPFVLLISTGATALFVAQRWTASPRRPPSPAATMTTAATPRDQRAATALPRLDREQRTEMLQRIEKAPGVSERRAAAAPPPELDAEYIRGQIIKLIPLIKECYENTLRGQPRTRGKLMVNFTIVAEPDIGGLVTDSTIDPTESTIADADLRECVQETMYGAQFPAPKDGGELHVTYPFVFATEE